MARGRKKVNINKLLCDLLHLSNFFLDESNNCVSLEINPLFVYENETVVTDCVMQKNCVRFCNSYGKLKILLLSVRDQIFLPEQTSVKFPLKLGFLDYSNQSFSLQG